MKWLVKQSIVVLRLQRAEIQTFSFNDSKFLRGRDFLYSRESKCAVFNGISVMIQSLEINYHAIRAGSLSTASSGPFDYHHHHHFLFSYYY